VENDFEAMSPEELLHNARAMAGRMHFDNIHDEEDAAQDAVVAMLLAEQRAEEGKPVRRFQRKSGKGVILNFYRANGERREHESLTLTKRVRNDEGTMEFVDLVPEEACEERREATEEAAFLDSLLESLPERERVIVRCRFYEDMTLAEIAEKVGCSTERVRQVEADALATLRHRWEQTQK
jgi:RNA polymerase sigma factor (sigma-70 family)